MGARELLVAILLVIAVAAIGFLVLTGGSTGNGSGPCVDGPRPSVAPGSAPHDRVEVWLVTPTGTVLTRVEAWIAATPDARQRGLSGVDHLEDSEGMLFVHGSEAVWSYSTAAVSVPLDIVFAGSAGEITAIHHEPAGGPPAGVSGRGQYVLQVPRGYTNETGVDVGDCLAVPPGLRNAA